MPAMSLEAQFWLGSRLPQAPRTFAKFLPISFPQSLSCPNPKEAKPGLDSVFPRGSLMLDAETTAILRAVLDEVCASVSHRGSEHGLTSLRKSWRPPPEARFRSTASGKSAAAPCPVH